MTEESAPISNRTAAHPKHRPARRRYLLAVLLLALTLLAGAVIGVSLTVVYFEKRPPRPPRPEDVGKALVDRMSEFLALSEKETKDLRAVVDRRMKVVKEIRDESWLAIREEFDALSEEVRELVGGERYAKWEAERNKRFGDKRKGPPGRGPRGRRRDNGGNAAPEVKTPPK